MSAIFKPPAQTQQPISLGQSATPNSPPPVHVRNDIATRYTLAGGYMPSANAGDGARQSFVSPPEDDRDTLEGMTGPPLPAITGFNHPLQNPAVGPTTLIHHLPPTLA